MWLCAILLKDPVVTENFIPIFQDCKKYFFDTATMIYASVIQNHQGCNTFRTGTQPHNYFLWNISFQLNATYFIRISTIYCPHPSILGTVDAINVKKLLNRKQNFQGIFFSEVCSNLFRELFLFAFLIIGK